MVSSSWPLVCLLLIVIAVVLAERQPRLQPLFRWLPVPLWCYALPMIAVTFGWLPVSHPLYPRLMSSVLPIALGLLLLGIELRSLAHVGWRALAATSVGTLSIVVGAPLIAWLLQHQLPPEAWKGVGALAATWTGGSMNLVSVRAIVQTPEAIFTSLIIVDALVAYGWMALLVALAPRACAIDQRLHATALHFPASSQVKVSSCTVSARLACLALALLLAWGARQMAHALPLTVFVNSVSGWTVLLVTTMAIGLSFAPLIQRLGRCAPSLGYPCLYLVLAAMGAQASLQTLWSAPIWLALGVGVAVCHGLSMLAAGRILRLPFGVLATASQANFGGVVSAPLVGAVYQLELAPVGLLLAIGCNALGTYLGLASAALCRAFLGN